MRCSTVGGNAVVVASALPALRIRLTSSYLSAMIGDIAALHLASEPGGPPTSTNTPYPAIKRGQTHAQTCLLDHVGEIALERGEPAVGVGPLARHARRVDGLWV